MSHNCTLFERDSECTAFIQLTFNSYFAPHRCNLCFGNKQPDTASVNMTVKALI